MFNFQGGEFPTYFIDCQSWPVDSSLHTSQFPFLLYIDKLFTHLLHPYQVISCFYCILLLQPSSRPDSKFITPYLFSRIAVSSADIPWLHNTYPTLPTRLNIPGDLPRSNFDSQHWSGWLAAHKNVYRNTSTLKRIHNHFNDQCEITYA